MSSPTSSLTSYRPDIASALEEFNLAMDRQGFIGHRILPVIHTRNAGGVFGKIPIEQLLQTHTTERAPGSGYARGNWQFTNDSFATVEHGWEEPVDENDRNVYAEWFNDDVDTIAGQRAFDFVLRNAELRAAALLFNATTWTGATLTTAITNEWDDATNATPIVDVTAAKAKVWALTGIWPNAVILNRTVFNNLRITDEIKDAIASSGAGDRTLIRDITEAQIAQAFDVDHVLVAGSAKNTAKEGQAVSISSIWSNEYVMVARVGVTNDLKEPCVGRTFHWPGDNSDPLGYVEEYEEPQTRSQIIRVRHQVQEKVLYTECAHLLSNATT